jgi:hypothetical protein
MLPEIRRDEGLYPVPQYEIEKVDITGFMDELGRIPRYVP